MEYSLTFLSIFFADLLYLSPILFLLIIAVCINGIVIGRIEEWGTFDSLYHAFINATTVGYGDFAPTTLLSRGLAVLNVFIGLLLTGVFVGAGVHAVSVTMGGV
ncbi:two pore domain potassium channel family protein [Rhodobacteraceae bacterium RKSG542]|uniref:potassium channel family protein n=1 Tax=Pseudovibrio flavus TaxID=2529854 RepID=UPI0012BBE4EA|nr:potassium channel family protein [Pseudovibrio flavus]MTI17016.1 two pore domain potassium channel family protein [Pseudovibrio flavus]